MSLVGAGLALPSMMKANLMTIKAVMIMVAAGVMVMPAQAQTIHRKVEANKAGVTAMAKVPVFPDKTPVAGMINAAMMTWGKKETAKFVRETETPPKDSATQHYEWEASPTVSYYYAPRVASVSFLVYLNLGGPHPNRFYRTFNYGVIDGKPKKLALTDLFRKGLSAGDIRQQVSDLILNKLRLGNQASLVQDGTITRLTDKQLDGFVLTPDGMIFLFAPYELGAYAEGSFEVKLSIGELGSDFRRSLLVAR
jgi:hypothetical protein